MLTALTVEALPRGKGFIGLINRLRRDRVEVEIRKAGGVCLKLVTYKSRNGRVSLDKIDGIIGAQRSRLLCNERLRLAPNSGYRRFYSNALAQRLCSNMALEVLAQCKNPEKIKVGIYDPEGASHDLLVAVLGYTSNVVVVTNEAQIYSVELERAMDKLGASAVVTKNISELSNCNFVIAPCEIESELPLKGDALVLASCAPRVQLKGIVYYKYSLRMPKNLQKLKPDDLEEEYFCSALYSLAHMHEMGSIVPNMCQSFSTAQTVKSLCAYIAHNA